MDSERRFDVAALIFVGARLQNNALFQECAQRGLHVPVVQAGDCLVPGTIQAAVHSGHRIARELIEGGKGVFRLEKPAPFQISPRVSTGRQVVVEPA